MKKAIAGFVAGALIFGSIGVFAGSYVANSVDFKVMVNGKEFTSDPPPLEVEGRTYLPLRAIGDALGVPVGWNEELRQAEVGTAPLEETNYSRNNPAPLNTVQKIDVDNYSTNFTAAVRIIETIRGEENILKVRKAYDSDDKPDEGYEFMMVKVAVSILSVDDDKAIDISSAYFTPYTSNNEETEKGYLYLDGEKGFSWLDKNVFQGGNVDGWFVIQVKKDDPAPKIVFGMKYDGTGGIWFALQ